MISAQIPVVRPRTPIARMHRWFRVVIVGEVELMIRRRLVRRPILMSAT